MAETQKRDGAIHKGHRQRLKNKVRANTLKALSEHEILELILTYSIPYKDTNALAHKLIDSYDNIKNVFYVPREDLAEYNGIGEETALYLNVIGQLHDYLSQIKVVPKIQLDSTNACVKYFRQNFSVGRKEEVYVIFTDSNDNFIRLERFGEGGLFSIELDRDKLYRLFAITGAKNLILFHTHPYGSIMPSSEDIATTQEIVQMCQLHHVKLFDHIIINKTEYYSFNTERLLSEMNSTAKNMIEKFFKKTTRIDFE